MKKRIVILGGGESGTGAALLAVTKGFDVFVSDGGKIADKYKDVLTKYGIAFEEGRHSEEKILDAAAIGLIADWLRGDWYEPEPLVKPAPVPSPPSGPQTNAATTSVAAEVTRL